MKAYKLFRVLKSGEITPLFINKTYRLPMGEWLPAEEHRTKGFKFRPGWYYTSKAVATHLSEKGRAWYEVEITDYEELRRPESQGGLYYLAKNMKIIKKVIN